MPVQAFRQLSGTSAPLDASPALLLAKSKNRDFSDWYRIGVTGENYKTLGERLSELNTQVRTPQFFTHLPGEWGLYWAVNLKDWMRGKTLVQKTDCAKDVLSRGITEKFKLGAANYFNLAVIAEECRLPDKSCFMVTDDRVGDLNEILCGVTAELRALEQVGTTREHGAGVSPSR